MLPLVRKVIETLHQKSYQIYTTPFKLNLVGIRKENARERIQYNILTPTCNDENIFFDQLLIFYYDEEEQLEFSLYDISSVPFIKEHKQSKILMPNQYKNAFCLQENSLRQIDNLDVFVDDFKQKSAFFDPFSLKSGFFDITIGAKEESSQSQRFKDNSDFQEFLELCQIHIHHYENLFSYTLLEEHEIIQHNKKSYAF